jgi:hypothetical protein
LKLNFNSNNPYLRSTMQLRQRSLYSVLLLSLLLSTTSARTQEFSAAPARPSSGGAATQSGTSNARAIQDNSFLVEEAYNQEDGVIQHISYFQRIAGDWVFTQTDEWPLRSLKNQLSLTVAATHASGFPGSGAGWGDTFINYRYQLLGSGDTRLAIAPRISLLLPSGNQRLGRGIGGTGMQTNLPLSFQVNRRLVTHWNAGVTWVARAQNEFQQRAGAVSTNLGQSLVWLVRPRFNTLVETVWTSDAEVIGRNRTAQRHELYISPGIRWAYNFKSGLQIVPGIGFPLGLGPSAGDKGVLLYLSFEHPLKLAHSRHAMATAIH